MTIGDVVTDSFHAIWEVIRVLGPGVLFIGLSAFLGKLWAERAAQNRSREISRELEILKGELRQQEQRIESSLAVGVMSHMASVAFDKHIEFCEAYLKEADQALAELLMNASAKTTLDSVGKMAEIRRKYGLWEDKQTGEFLTKFQKALSEIWMIDRKIERSERAMLTFEQRQSLVTDFFNRLQTLVGIVPEIDVGPDGITRERVLQFLRSRLGADDLTKLRFHHLNRAVSDVTSSAKTSSAHGG